MGYLPSTFCNDIDLLRLRRLTQLLLKYLKQICRMRLFLFFVDTVLMELIFILYFSPISKDSGYIDDLFFFLSIKQQHHRHLHFLVTLENHSNSFPPLLKDETLLGFVVIFFLLPILLIMISDLVSFLKKNAFSFTRLKYF